MASAAALRTALLLAACCMALGFGPAWYSCDPSKCKAPECVCASDSAPRALAPEDVPQFIILTHDDAITAATDANMRAVITNHKNKNGCNMPATFFVLKQDTDCELARKFYDENSELAIHSTTHVPLRDPFPGGTAALEAEMFGARDFLNQTCGIPLEDLVGFRTPLLAHNPPVRAALSKAGFLYDSSIPEVWPGATSPNATARLWPYSMEYGIPQDCAYFEGSRCDESERYPGLWQFPLLELEQDGGQLVAVMDPGQQAEGGLGYGANVTGGLSADALEELLRTNFDFSYNGNRAPFGLYIHTPWFNKDTIEGTNRFLEYALQLEGVYAVTARQVIEWMQDPVPISQMDDWLQCKQVNVTVVESLAGKKCQVHTVKSGETGGVVAGIYAVSLGDLAAVNPGTDLNVLAVGDTLNIPPWDASCQKPGSSKTDS
jgi:LysM repeat protein